MDKKEFIEKWVKEEEEIKFMVADSKDDEELEELRAILIVKGAAISQMLNDLRELDDFLLTTKT